jgi:hypothetical protein
MCSDFISDFKKGYNEQDQFIRILDQNNMTTTPRIVSSSIVSGVLCGVSATALHRTVRNGGILPLSRVTAQSFAGEALITSAISCVLIAGARYFGTQNHSKKTSASIE